MSVARSEGPLVAVIPVPGANVIVEYLMIEPWVKVTGSSVCAVLAATPASRHRATVETRDSREQEFFIMPIQTLEGVIVKGNQRAWPWVRRRGFSAHRWP